MITKRFLIGLLIIIILAGAVGMFLFYNPQSVADNTVEQPSDNLPSQTIDTKIESGGISAQGTNGGGTLSICADKCGDGVCQKTSNCNDDFNCVCVETSADCPADCK